MWKEEKKKAGMIHVPSRAVINEQCQLIDLNINVGLLQRTSASCSHVVKKSKWSPDLSEEGGRIQQRQQAQWISQKRKY